MTEKQADKVLDGFGLVPMGMLFLIGVVFFCSGVYRIYYPTATTTEGYIIDAGGRLLFGLTAIPSGIETYFLASTAIERRRILRGEWRPVINR
jgi:hypothetical protein